MMKTCSKCKVTKPKSEFNKVAANDDGHHAYCRDCSKKVAYDYYRANKPIWRRRRIADTRKIKEWFSEYKGNLKCDRCPEDHPGCLVFHHNDPGEKEMTISNAVNGRWGKKRILAEMAKCTVLCSNCHNKLHWEERNKLTDD